MQLHRELVLGWADDRLTDYASIQRCWERVFSAYFLVSLQAQNFQTLADEPLCVQSTQLTAPSWLIAKFQQHRWWEHGTTWKSALDNIRLIIQPFLFYCLISRWLEVFNLPGFQHSFGELLHTNFGHFPRLFYTFLGYLFRCCLTLTLPKVIKEGLVRFDLGQWEVETFK